MYEIIPLPHNGEQVDIYETCFIETNGIKVKILNEPVDEKRRKEDRRRIDPRKQTTDRMGSGAKRTTTAVIVLKVGKTLIIDCSRMLYDEHLYGYGSADQPIPDDLEIVQAVNGKFYDVKKPRPDVGKYQPIERETNPDLADYRPGMAGRTVQNGNGDRVFFPSAGLKMLECSMCRERKCKKCSANKMAHRQDMEEAVSLAQERDDEFDYCQWQAEIETDM